MNKKPIFLILILSLFTIALLSIGSFLFLSHREIAREKRVLQANLQENVTFVNTYFANVENEFTNFIQKWMPNKGDLEKAIASSPKSYLFESLIFVSKEGEILYGQGKGKNIYKDQFDDKELHLALTRAHLTQTFDRSRVIFNAKEKQEVIYLTFPLGSGTGVISFPLKLNSFQRRADLNDEEIAFFQVKEVSLNIIASSFTQYNGTAFSDALLGHEGKGVLEIEGVKTVAAWGFIPKLNWGVMVKSDLTLLLQPYQFLKTIFHIALIFLMLTLLVFIILKYSSFLFFILPSLLLLISIVGIVYALSGFYRAKQESIASIQEVITRRLDDFLKTTSLELKDVTHTTEWLAKDLSSGKLQQEDLFIRLARDFKEIPTLQKMHIAFDPPPYLAYEISRSQDAIKTTTITDFSYTKESWYSMGESKKNRWSVFYDEKNDKEVAVYTASFFDGKKGTIFTFYDFSKLITNLKQLPLSSWGKGFYLLEEGSIPNSNLVTTKMEKGKFYTFINKKTNKKTYVVVKAIPNTPWIIGGEFTASDIKIEGEKIHALTLILITSLLLFALSLLSFFCKKRMVFSTLFVFFTSAALLSIWIAEHLIVENAQTNALIIRDKIELDNFIYIVKKTSADLLLEEPIFIPTGIQIQFLELQSNDFLSFSGLLWQKYPQHIETRGVFFPQATTISLDKIPNSNPLIDNWRVRATLVQKPDKSAFPFDDYLIKIQIRSLNENPAIYLIPDLEGYRNLVSKEKLGISQNFSIPGYKLNQTFFTLEKEDSQAYLGQIGKERASYTLYYNIYLVRNFLIPFLPFLIPVIVVMIGLYAIFLLTKKDRRINFMTSISVYTGGFFAFAILQLNLRTQYGGDNILYGETFFFVGYFLICLLYAHAILLKNARKENFLTTHKPLLDALFWPLLISIWYIIALIYFF